MSDPVIIEITLDGPVVEVEVPGLQGPAGDPLDFGGQIPFPATQNPSADANTLDDYEEGTWTPVFTTTGTPPTGVTYGGQFGFYTKIGNLVHIEMRVQLTSKGTGGTLLAQFTGLPFASANNGANIVVHAANCSNIDLPAGYSQFTGAINSNVATVLLQVAGDNVAQTNSTWDHFTDTSVVKLSGTYRAAA